MSCYHPMLAYRSKAGRSRKTGAWPIVFSVKQGYKDLQVQIPCGRCIGCRLDRSREWANRCVAEAREYDRNCFITLTYNDKFVQKSLNKRDFVLFMKRLRKANHEGIRFFHCGEYGSLLSRPHHHACLFNYDFTDKKLWTTRRGVSLYRSEHLESLWSDPDTGESFGFSTIGDVSFESAAYVARYVTKKITGEKATEHYDGRVPEYITMSRGSAKLGTGGIGRRFVERFMDDIYKQDKLYVRPGIPCRPGRFYDSIFDDHNPEGMARVKRERRRKAKEQDLKGENTYERLEVKEAIKKQQVSRLKRHFEEVDL